MTCPACGTAVPDGARFCPSCGQDLRFRGDERRVVTVLFGDLVGFTGLSEARDPEQVKNLVDRCFERLVVDIEAFGGRVDKIVGDAIVALFGAPVAHEDDAERAVRAALQMQRTLATADADGVQMRIGVNTGEVLVGALRAGGDYTAMGDVVNTAARLQETAAPGQVLVGPSTHAVTRQVIGYDHLGEIRAKGREEPVDAWVAVEALVPPGHRPRRPRAPLVGREPEVGLLTHAVASAVRRRRAHLLVLVGEAGMGKSRLAEEVASLAECNHGALVLEGRCVPYGEANVWWPVAEAVRSACGITQSDGTGAAADKARARVAEVFERAPDDAEVSRVTAGLLHLMGYEGSLREIDAGRAREEATRSLVAMVKRDTRRQPVVLVVSDLHWADDAVLDLLDTLLEQVCGQPVVVVATTRRTIEDRWAPKPGRHDLVVVNLEPLERDASATLLRSLVEGYVAPEVEELLLDRSGGNPFFLEELVALVTEGSDGSAARAEVSPGQIAHLPDTLRGLVAARLDALTPDERRVLEDAAVLGRSGPVESLVTMARKAWGVEDIDVALRGLVDKEALIVDGRRWSFRSDLVREVAYGTLTKADRARRHAGIAKYLEEHVVGSQAAGEQADDATVDRIANNYATAAELAAEVGNIPDLPDDLAERALAWLEQAAARAEASDTPLVAVRLFGQALELIGPQPGSRRLRLLLGRASARAELRELVAARADVAEALEESQAAGDDAGYARSVLALGDIQQKEGDLDTSLETLSQARSLFERLGDRRGVAEALRQSGMAQLFMNDLAGAERSLAAALDEFVALGDRRGEAWALQNLSWTSYIAGQADEAEARLRESAATFEEIGDAGGLGWARGLLAFVRFHQGHAEEAEGIGEQVLLDARERGDRWGHGMMLVLTGVIRLWTGRAQQAIPRAEEARDLFRSIGDHFGEMQAVGVLGRAMVVSGQVEEGFALLDHGHGLEAPLADGQLGTTLLLAAAAQIGDPERVRWQLDAACADCEDIATIGAGDRAVALGLVFLQMGALGDAIRWLEMASGGATGMGIGPYACSALALARLAEGRVDDALELAGTVDRDPRATYSDRLVAAMARGLAYARRGEVDTARAAFADAIAAVDGTEDAVGQAVARLAEAVALTASSTPDAAEHVARADGRLAELGLEADGWTTAFHLALGKEHANSRS
jgi:class 3 adenylate cyclase/tetratricopeptide (TPR) repeat protein